MNQRLEFIKENKKTHFRLRKRLRKEEKKTHSRPRKRSRKKEQRKKTRFFILSFINSHLCVTLILGGVSSENQVMPLTKIGKTSQNILASLLAREVFRSFQIGTCREKQ